MGEENKNDTIQEKFIETKIDPAEGFAQALIDREKKRGVKGDLPSQEKQIEYIYLTLKKKEKRARNSLYLKWIIRIAIVVLVYNFYANWQMIMNKYILPEVINNVTSSLGQGVFGSGQLNMMSGQTKDVNSLIQQIGKPGGADSLSSEEKKTIKQKLQENIEFYKTILE